MHIQHAHHPEMPLTGIRIVHGKNGITANHVHGCGKLNTVHRHIQAIDTILLSGPISLTVTTSATQTIKITADETILPLITTKVLGNTLYIDCEGDFSTDNEVSITVEIPLLKRLATRGTGNVNIIAESHRSIALDHKGSGDIHISGDTISFTAEVLGSGRVRALALKSKSALLSLQG